ncbi:nuclear transport factor 2 family protein [Mycobacterium hodleri]|uniref:nuclear transport factor 2 family protein n=1 Tax=Mycolicibacterium hodleri TaxID=49897 RepID=UPI0021F2580F|nr:nuclear transport factor 2 family protein [Mycolicibacterium hodleri]MCV7136364.1 nuclear transport factor 2 family protein [Mycolicibacterium hodleri]
MTDSTPGAVFAAATAAISAGDVDGWLAHCRDDVVLEFPYAPTGRPRRVEGKPAVEEYLRAVPGQVEFERITRQHVHQTVDPDTAVIEWSVTGHVKATGAPYEMSYVVVLTLVDGLIAVYRDYWNPLTLLEAALS